jgi:hypothetical protein
MTDSQILIIISSILIPMMAGFGWMICWLRSIDHRINDLDTRITVIETILAMMGAPIKLKNKDNQ